MPLLEIFARGTLVYLGVFILLRVVFKRQSGTLSITDLIVVVFIADASQNAMADNYRSVPDGLLLVAVILLWVLCSTGLLTASLTSTALSTPGLCCW